MEQYYSCPSDSRPEPSNYCAWRLQFISSRNGEIYRTVYSGSYKVKIQNLNDYILVHILHSHVELYY